MGPARNASLENLPLDKAIGLLSGQSSWLTKRIPRLGHAFLADGPHGVRARPADSTDLAIGGTLPATCFPTAVTLASTWDPDLVRRVGRAIGKEAKQLGVDVVLGPGLNLKRHPLCGRNFEYFSEDPYLTGVLATALTEGLQSSGVGASAKHFAVNNQETNRFVVDARVDLRTLHELYLRGFEMVVRNAKPWTVMAAYNLVNGEHACENQYLLTQVLRDDWGFDGLVMSDWGAVSDRVAGVKAGLDLEMPGSKGLWDGEVAKAVAAGTLDKEDVLKCATRVVDLIARSNRNRPAKPEVSDRTLAKNDALAREAAAAGAVLLKNDGILPLKPATKVAAIGAFAAEPRYQGFGSSHVNAAHVTSALDEFGARGVTVEYARGYDPLKSEDDASALTEAVVAARNADVAIVFAGLPPFIESESFDRENLLLPAQHDALITAVAAANPNVVVVLFNGAPVLMPWLSEVRAVLEVYLGGQAGGGAIVDLLYGDANPSGRLAETFPRRLSDVPANANFPGSPHQVIYAEQEMVGYRHNVTNNVHPLFPFGFGLSYTTFLWDDIAVDREWLDITELPDGAGTLAAAATVSLVVKNTGSRAGADVIQIYLHDRTGLVTRPRRELAAFAKVYLGSNESQKVKIAIPKAAFAAWDVEKRRWRVPSGHWEIEVARHSQDVIAVLPVTVSGDLHHPLPASPAPAAEPERPVKPFTRDSTMSELEQSFVGRRLAAMVRKGAFPAEGDELTNYMVERQTNELPIRAGAMFSNGRLSLKMVDAILAAANGKATGLLGVFKR